MNEAERQKFADIIENKLSFTNGWAISPEKYRKLCEEAATLIQAARASESSPPQPELQPGEFIITRGDGVQEVCRYTRQSITIPCGAAATAPSAPQPAKCPECEATNEEEASKSCNPIEGQCPIIEAGFWKLGAWPTQSELNVVAAPSAPTATCPKCKLPIPTEYCDCGNAIQVAPTATDWMRWRDALLDAWRNHHQATMTALLEGGPLYAAEHAGAAIPQTLCKAHWKRNCVTCETPAESTTPRCLNHGPNCYGNTAECKVAGAESKKENG